MITKTKFKVGAWVRYIKGKTKKTAKVILTDQIKDYVGISTGENVPIEECELWKPNKEEWVWINTRVDSLPFIACLITQIKVDGTLVFTDYSYTTNGKRKDILIHPDELISLEPFIGELPSFIDNKG